MDAKQTRNSTIQLVRTRQFIDCLSPFIVMQTMATKEWRMQLKRMFILTIMKNHSFHSTFIVQSLTRSMVSAFHLNRSKKKKEEILQGESSLKLVCNACIYCNIIIW